jgi:hypothetical protein
VLREFESNILLPKGLDVVDLIQEFGYEFTWYNYFLQKRGGVIHEVEPFFLVIHSGLQLVEHQFRGKTTMDLSRAFIGVVVNGNFQHFREPANMEDRHLLNAVAQLSINQLFVLSLRFSLAFAVRVLISPVIAGTRVMRQVKEMFRS